MPRNLWGYMADAVRNIGQEIPEIYNQEQQRKRQKELDQYDRYIQDAYLKIAQDQEARAAEAAQQNAAQQPEGYQPRNAWEYALMNGDEDLLARLRAQEEWRANLEAAGQTPKPAKPVYAPKEAEKRIEEIFGDRVKRGRTDLLGEADQIAARQGLVGADGKPLTVNDRSDLVSAQLQFRPASGSGWSVKQNPYDKLLQQYDYTGSDRHRQAFESSSDSIEVAAPLFAQLLMAGMQGGQNAGEEDPQAAAEAWAAENIENWTKLPAKTKRSIIEKRMREMQQ